MINAMPGMSGQQLPQGVTPEMLANPQFLAMLRAQMGGGGVAHPAMGGGGGGMGSLPVGRTLGGQPGGSNQLNGALQQYMRQQQPQMTSKGISNPTGENQGGLLGSMFGQQGGDKAPIDTSYGPQLPQQPVQQQGGLLGSFGGGYGGYGGGYE